MDFEKLADAAFADEVRRVEEQQRKEEESRQSLERAKIDAFTTQVVTALGEDLHRAIGGNVVLHDGNARYVFRYYGKWQVTKHPRGWDIVRPHAVTQSMQTAHTEHSDLRRSLLTEIGRLRAEQASAEKEAQAKQEETPATPAKRDDQEHRSDSPPTPGENVLSDPSPVARTEEPRKRRARSKDET